MGGLYGETITKLTNLRNTHGRGNYIERWVNKENLVYERDKSAIVALSNRTDNGFDTYTVQTNFGPGTRLLEATGNAKVVFDAMEILAPNGVLCLLSVTGGSGTNVEPIDRINQLLVLGNQVVFGSVNANPRHFAKGVEDFVTIEKNWPGALSRLLTNRIPWDDFNSWFTQRGTGIKTTLEIV